LEETLTADTYIGQWIFDKATQLVVKMQQGSLAAMSEAAMMAGTGNMFLWGQEIIQAASVTQLPNGNYVVSDMLRGLRGTEWAMSTHAGADAFTPVSSLTYFPLGAAAVGAVVLVRVSNAASTVQQSIALSNNDLKPHSPASVIPFRDVYGDLIVTWIRRDRMESQWQDSIGTIPMSETVESYDVDVIDPSSGDVVRHLAQNSAGTAVFSPNVGYTAEQQTDDFGYIPQYVTLYIYQNSSIVGRGIPAQVTV
jgi:hypothetical protein